MKVSGVLALIGWMFIKPTYYTFKAASHIDFVDRIEEEIPVSVRTLDLGHFAGRLNNGLQRTLTNSSDKNMQVMKVSHLIECIIIVSIVCNTNLHYFEGNVNSYFILFTEKLKLSGEKLLLLGSKFSR